MSVLPILLCLRVLSPAVKGVGLQKLVIRAVGEESQGFACSVEDKAMVVVEMLYPSMAQRSLEQIR